MKTKISKILGLGLALVMVLSMAFALLPAKVEAAPTAWTPEVLPAAGTQVLRPASNVTGFAVGPDGTTIWAIDSQVGVGAILRSTNGGRTFAPATNPPAPYAGPPLLVAVAPDNPNVALVSDSTATGGIVWLTTNGGISWASLGTPTAGATTNSVTDIAISPAILGAILQRHFFATVADDALNATALGFVRELGTPAAGANWANVLAAGVATTHDYMAIEVTPGYVGDQSITVVGALPSAAGVAVGVDYMIININTGLLTRLVQFVTGDFTDDFAIAPATQEIVSADIALPIDFDATSIAFERAYVGLGSFAAATTDDVYRIDGAAFRRLNAVTTVAVQSVAFSGTINGGVLFLGQRAAANVRFSPDPTTGAPSWINSAKSPTGAVDAAPALTIVRVSPGFQTDNTVFGGTTGAESALSRSVNGGVSFNQISLIDTAIDGLSDVMPTPDGKTMYLATWNATVGVAQPESLWKSAVPSNPASWERIRLSIIAGAPADWGDVVGESIIRLNPDWATTPRLYWASSGAVAATNIQTSSNGGDTYANRIAGFAIQDLVAEDGSILYYGAQASPNVFSSSTAAYTWGPPVNGQAAAVTTLAMAPSYPLLPVAGNLLVGGTTAVGYSLDGGTTFARTDTGLAPTGALQVLAHQDYATNSTIFCGDSAGVNTFVSTTAPGAGWSSMITGSANPVVGLGMENGVFYSLQALGADRTLVPLAAPGTIPWTIAAAGAIPTPVPGPSGLRVAGGTLFAVDTTPGGAVVTYGDILQTAKTTITSPASGAVIPIDPVIGRAELVKLSWTAMGFGPGLVDNYNVLIYEKDQGVPGGTIAATAVLPGPTVAAPTVDIFVGAVAPNIPYVFRSGEEYGIMIQAIGQVSTPAATEINSGWSDPVFISIEFGGVVTAPHGGPILQGPQPGAMNVDPGTGFSWAIISGATQYEFILATDAALTTAIAGTPVTVNTPSFGPVTLDYNTDYWYAVRATGPATSPQSVAFFHTMAEPVPPPPPVEIPPVQVISPAWIWAVVIIGAILVIAVIFLIVSTRRSA